MTNNSHDLRELMKQATTEMASEYSRIQNRTKKNTDVAGHHGEKNWGNLLKQWLPRTLHVAFGGAITSPDGNDISPQIDILVMNDTYPKEMIEKDLFMIDGVLAAFECKATLRSADIAKAVKTSSMLKQWCQVRTGSPYAELYSPVTYGLLAHGHCWTKEKSRPEHNVINRLMQEDFQTVNHPKESLDLICVANLGTWAIWKNTLQSPDGPPLPAGLKRGDFPSTHYLAFTNKLNGNRDDFTPIGSALSHLLNRLAWEMPSLRDLAIQFFKQLSGSAKMHERIWDTSICSDPVRHRVEQRLLSHPKLGSWDEWSRTFFP